MQSFWNAYTAEIGEAFVKISNIAADLTAVAGGLAPHIPLGAGLPIFMSPFFVVLRAFGLF